MLRFSANLGFLWKDLPLLDAVRRAKAAGFDAVEFHRPYDVPADVMRAALAEVGLPAVSLNTRSGDAAVGEFGLAALPGRGAEARTAIDEALAYAEAIDASAIHVIAGKIDPQSKEARRVYLESLDYAATEAAGKGRIIVIEPLNRRDVPGYILHSIEDAAEIVREVGSDSLKVMFDCYHVQIEHGDLIRRFERLLPVIGHVQVAAVPSRREPDEGEIAYERLLNAMEDIGYRGFIGAEYNPRNGVEEGLGWLASFKKGRRA
jgi:2-dehydrotetronate isomerase